MGFTADGQVVWPVPPDWADGVRESIGFATEILQASATGVTQHLDQRDAPVRAMSFDVICNAQDRRVADMLLAGYGGKWLLPLWPDVQLLPVALSAGATTIACRTQGFDFAAGGRALLWRGVNQWEVVDVEAVEAPGLALADGIVGSWPAGTRLYPLRLAYADDAQEEVLKSDDLGKRSLTFTIAEPCDWPVLTDLPAYLGHPVLNRRHDEGEDPKASHGRLLATADNGTGTALQFDVAGISFRSASSGWKLFGREEHTWYRSLLYTLRGRARPMWVPSWTQDLKVVAPISSAATTVSVQWAGYTLFGKGKHNRKDVRIELNNGTVFYRRISNAVEAGANETLTLSSALGVAVTPGQIRCVSFMALCTLASDEIDIEHETDADGVATSTLPWKAVVPDV